MQPDPPLPSLEFRSTVDTFMAVRLLTYVGLLYEDLRKAGDIPAGGPLPPVLSIVLYNGHSRWSAATSLEQLIDPALPEQLKHWQPSIIELQEMQTMLAERVKTWTEEWKQQGLEQGPRTWCPAG